MAERALIVAHGQPSSPGPANAEIVSLAGRVASHLPGWQVRGATLAAAGALADAIAGLGPGELSVYPLFMADGWFTATHLPARLAEAGATQFHQLPPFGLDPAVQTLTVDLVRHALGGAGGSGAILLAAHGSFRSPRPAAVAEAMAARIASETGARVVTAFIDQPPRIAEVAATLSADAICLPFFAARGGHVLTDLPRALDEARFAGRVLDPVGCDPSVPRLIADALLGR